MSITYPLDLPNNKIARITISSASAVAISRSPFSYKTQTQAFSGQMWFSEVTLPPMVRADADLWIAFLLKLNGVQGTMLLGDRSKASPKGTPLGTPVVSGSGQSGQSLVTTGWTPSATNVLKAGDYFQIGSRLYMNLNDASANGSGNATLDIFPRLRESPSSGATIITSNCVGLFRLASSSAQMYSVDAASIHGMSFSAEEAV